jgi:hypothetical protein
MSNEVMMVLQNCMDFLKVEPGLNSEILVHPPYSHDGNQISDIKVEEDSDNEALQDPLLIPLPEVKVEHEVSYFSASPPLGTFHRYPELWTDSLFSVCLSVCSHQDICSLLNEF